MKRRSFLVGSSLAVTAIPASAQLRSPAQWLQADGTPRIAKEAHGTNGKLRVWIVAMPKPLWRDWWSLLPLGSEAPSLVDGLVQSYLPDDEIALSLLVSGALRDDSHKRKLVATITIVNPNGAASAPILQDYFWEGMPFNRSNSVGILEPLLSIGDDMGRSTGPWKLGVEITDTLASASVSVSQKIRVGA